MLVTATCWALIGSRFVSGIAPIWVSEDNQIERLPFGERKDESRVTKHTLDVDWMTPAEKGMLVAVYPPRMNLQGDPIAPNLNLWPGGECVERRSIWKSRNCERTPRKDWPPNRYEVFLLFEGEVLALFDRHGRANILTAISETPVLESVTHWQVIDYLLKSGLHQTRTTGVDWALRNIEAIGVYRNLDTRQARRQLESLKRSFNPPAYASRG